MTVSPGGETICGIWAGPDGRVHLSLGSSGSAARRSVQTDLRPFAWVKGPPAGLPDAVRVEPLAGDGAFDHLVTFGDAADYEAFVKANTGVVDTIRSRESQFLIAEGRRTFEGIPFARLRRCQLDIETACGDGRDFPDPEQPEDRILAIGLRLEGKNRLLELEADTDDAEAALLHELNHYFRDEDPDILEGHNLFKFDLDYLRRRARRLQVPLAWGRFGQPARFRNSRLRVAERWIDYPRCDLPGREIVDTYLLAQIYDLTTREMQSYGLKEVALQLGVTSEEDDGRTYLDGGLIGETFREDRERFRAYLADDLRETEGIAAVLLPTYFEQVRVIPTTLQEAVLRGTAAKVDLLLLERYHQARGACPLPVEVKPFAGGFTRSFREGVFRDVLHFDVASLYPSLLLLIGRNPRPDHLGIFIPLLKELRTYRLDCKQRAARETEPSLKLEYQARQASFKILINSFYGYLGFSGARFADGELAAEVTARGRELLQKLIEAFEKEGAQVLEADTDGLYLACPDRRADPEALLEAVAPVLPAGIELEFDGRYAAMLCYKAKNYALLDGDRIIVRGSALRSRGMEPFLRELTRLLIRNLLGAGGPSAAERLAELREQIPARRIPIGHLAKSEILSQNPEVYRRAMEAGGKPRRASAEAALQLAGRPRMGDRVAYYIVGGAKPRTPDWQRARPVELYDAETAPYDADYYLKKLDDWAKRYATFLDDTSVGGRQGSLFD
ncbi:MAG: DNA polymerase [Puniceicoccaceae bacterium]|nr:MAG: DNA polymerase [Puniceicoccaceae bacterium]